MTDPHPRRPAREPVGRKKAVKLQHRLVRAVLMKTVGIEEEALPAFNSRLRHMFAQGLGPQTSTSPAGRGHRREYSLLDTLNLALSLQIQRAFVDPVIAAAFILEELPTLDGAWRTAVGTIKPVWLELELDAFARMTHKEIAMGRRGAVRVAGKSDPERGVQPAPRLKIDLAALVNRVGGALIAAGVSASAISEALHDLRTGERGQILPEE